MVDVEKLSCRQLLSVVYPRIFRLKTNEGHWTENKITISFYRIPVACKCILSYLWVCLRRHFVCFSPVSRPRTQILSLFILAAILNKFPLSVDKSVTWFVMCAMVFSPANAILESEKTLGKRLVKIHVFQLLPTIKVNIVAKIMFVYVLFFMSSTKNYHLSRF